MSGSVIVGVDVGGTFTDVFAIDSQTGHASIAKVPTTPDNQAEGFARGVQEGAGAAAHLDTIVHGTTVGTNALLQRRGARVEHHEVVAEAVHLDEPPCRHVRLIWPRNRPRPIVLGITVAAKARRHATPFA